MNIVSRLKSLSKASLIMIGVGVASITLAVTSIGVGFGIQNSKAAVVDEGAFLFASKTSGAPSESSIVLARQLMTLADAAGKTTISGKQTSDAAQIRTANGTAETPWVKLFETVSGAAASSAAWRLTYITWDGATPLFTFWADDIGVTSVFNAGTTSTQCLSRYESPSGKPSDFTGSALRNKVGIDLYNDLDTKFSGMSTKTVAPYAVGWQNTQGNVNIVNDGDTFTSGSQAKRNALNSGVNTDRLWVPSYFEVSHDGNAANSLWHLTKAEAKVKNPALFNSSSSRDYAYLRSSFYDPGQNHLQQEQFATAVKSATGDKSRNWWCFDQLSVRPAVHINGASVRAIAELPIAADNQNPGDGGNGDGGDDNGGDDGDGGDDNGGDNGGSDGVDPTQPVGPNNPIVPDYKEQSQKGLSAGAIGGIIGGVLVAVGGATCGVIWFVSRRRRQANA